MNDLLGVALQVIDALDACGIRYTIGGSLASSFSGEPRASIDVDIVVDLSDDRVDPFIRRSERPSMRTQTPSGGPSATDRTSI
jgi:hypothetical protein